MAITGKLLRSDIQDFLISTRFATVIQFALLALVVYLFVKSEVGTAAGVFAAGLVAFSPRLFAQALLATYDIPMVLFWVIATIAFYKGMTSRRWAVASGVAFGLALLTKENALLMPLALWPWGLLFYRRKSLPAILSMCVIGPIVMYAGWPWLWLHPLANAWRYVTDKFQFDSVMGAIMAGSQADTVRWRHMIQTLYLGKVYESGPPWHYPFVVTLFGMPLATIVGAAWATIDARRNGKEPLVGLLLWSICAQLLVFAFVEKPYDGDRLFLPVVALVAILGGLGLYWLAKRARWAAASAVILLVLSPGCEFFIYAPYGMSYYTPIIGGLPGAEKLGMEVTYYGEAVSAENFAAINSRAREGDRVAFGPMFKNVRRMLDEFIRYGYLKLGLVPAAELGDWEYLIFVNRGGFIETADREALESGTVISENKLLGVTLVTVVERRKEAGGE
jgi:4-amino-4-deoxy-L-arabinose transferase-like glycosyltransferase